MTVKYVIRSLHLLYKKNAVVLVLGILPIARQGKVNGMASVVSSKNHNSIYLDKFWSKETKFSSS